DHLMPLPGIITPSMVRSSPPTSVQAHDLEDGFGGSDGDEPLRLSRRGEVETGDNADPIVRLDFTVAVKASTRPGLPTSRRSANPSRTKTRRCSASHRC